MEISLPRTNFKVSATFSAFGISSPQRIIVKEVGNWRDLIEHYSQRLDITDQPKHKLAPVADGPYKVVNGDDKNVFVEIGKQHEGTSRDRILKSPAPTRLSQDRISAERQQFSTQKLHSTLPTIDVQSNGAI